MGSIRREKEEIGDIDIVLIPEEGLWEKVEEIMDVILRRGQKDIWNLQR